MTPPESSTSCLPLLDLDHQTTVTETGPVEQIQTKELLNVHWTNQFPPPLANWAAASLSVTQCCNVTLRHRGNCDTGRCFTRGSWRGREKLFVQVYCLMCILVLTLTLTLKQGHGSTLLIATPLSPQRILIGHHSKTPARR